MFQTTESITSRTDPKEVIIQDTEKTALRKGSCICKKILRHADVVLHIRPRFPRCQVRPQPGCRLTAATVFFSLITTVPLRTASSTSPDSNSFISSSSIARINRRRRQPPPTKQQQQHQPATQTDAGGI